jgi:hypothetical protein
MTRKEEKSMLSKRHFTKIKSYTIMLALILSMLIMAGCGALGSNTPTPVPSTPIPPSPTTEVLMPAATVPAGPAVSQAEAATPTSIPPSPTPEPPLATSTLVLSNQQILPTAISVPPTGNIVFAAGTTATIVQGTLAAGQVATYTLQAGQSQVLVLIMDSLNKDVTLGLFDPNGNILLNPANKWRSGQVVLPTTGLYRIQVTGGATTENFILTVKAAQIVNFASGTSSITMNGITAYGYPFDYSFNCGAGQTMTASLSVPSSTATLDIFEGATSNMLLFESAMATTWSGVLPQTQPYVVEIIPNNFAVVSFSLTVSCTGTTSTVYTQTGTIVIKPGSTAAVKHGTVGPGGMVSYTLQASQYQPLCLNIGTVGTANNNVYLGVLYPDGTTFLSPTKKYLNWQWRLPVTGLYTIQAFGSSTTENFELTIKLPKIVYFNETNSITLKSATEQGFIVSYAIYGNDGETLSASLNVPSTTAYLDVFGMQHGALLSYQDKANSWSGVLPDTEMYIIEVIPRGGWIYGYTLTLTRK